MRQAAPFIAMVVAVLAVWVVVAHAAPPASDVGRYDASVSPLTGDLHILDRRTNTFYFYGQHENTWVMRGSIDLTQTGAVKLEPRHPSPDELREALQSTGEDHGGGE